jgi:meiosis-specific protein HOP1
MLLICLVGASRLTCDQIECSACETWQHLHCYGYIGSNDPRIPDDHYCYQCILDYGKDTTAYKALKDLTVRRRVMFRVNEHGMRTRTDLAKDLCKQLHVHFRGLDSCANLFNSS